jgi:hypothetical protein
MVRTKKLMLNLLQYNQDLIVRSNLRKKFNKLITLDLFFAILSKFTRLYRNVRHFFELETASQPLFLILRLP